MIQFTLEGEYIKLDQLLKAVSIADSGGQAKHLIVTGMVKVNGTVATERGKKIRQGDQVICEREIIEVV
ncbi:RNA-binding S4 domain-containing protein [Anoxynatronum buryatiense]|uniref:Ribosome-associated protein n=1 Tax=Anoxynatronum buryatiense TaxID=489973 RepID=A0AA45WW89_9CLOT|nr:RNA-binding S4 domain-containing protein [Anoxynatronum buryatiense]SMP58348.1 ribosome-associated protein [Anoxynatronum buryatiense]